MKYKFFMKLLALCLTVVFVSGCNLINVVDTTVIATVNGEEILVSEYMYYYAAVKEQIISMAGETNLSDEFWTTTDIEGQKAGEFAKEKALENATVSAIVAQRAKQEGFSADSSDAKAQINSAKDSVIKQFSAYDLSEEGVEVAVTKAYLSNQLLNRYVADGTIVVDDAKVADYYASNYRTAKHILILTTDPQTGEVVRSEEEAKALADDTVQKLANGANFDSLMNELTEDPGLEAFPNGYTFANDGSMTEEFSSAVFKLNENEISEPVEVSYGYHIIKRVPLISLDDFVAEQATTEEEQQQVRDSLTQTVIYAEEDKLIQQWQANASIEIVDKEYNKI